MCLKIFVIKCEKLKEVKEISKKPLPSLNNSNSEKSFTFDLNLSWELGAIKDVHRGPNRKGRVP